jgi:outer membrane protein
MKNISLILNAVLFLLVGYLYFVQFSGKKTNTSNAIIVPPSAVGGGVKIAYVNADTLDAKYEWLKQQRQALEQRIQSAENTMLNEKQALMKDMDAFQKKYQAGTVPPAELEAEYANLTKRQEALAGKEERLGKQLAEEQKKASNEFMANVEQQLKSLQSQIGYDYILSYSKGGGQVLLANDSLDITNQVLDLLNNAQKK